MLQDLKTDITSSEWYEHKLARRPIELIFSIFDIRSADSWISWARTISRWFSCRLHENSWRFWAGTRAAAFHSKSGSATSRNGARLVAYLRGELVNATGAPQPVNHGPPHPTVRMGLNAERAEETWSKTGSSRFHGHATGIGLESAFLRLHFHTSRMLCHA